MSARPASEDPREHGADASEAWNPAAAVARHARETPDAVALVLDDEPFTYARLAGAAAGVASRLGPAVSAAAGGGGTACVAVLASRSFATYAGILGAAWAGAAWVPMNPAHPPARLASVLARARPLALVVDADAAPRLHHPALAGLLPNLVLAGDSMMTGEAAGPARPAPRSPRDTAYVLFTSGTTGEPKGVVVSCGALAAFLGEARRLFAIDGRDRVGQLAETSFDLSVFEVFAAWDGGAALHVVPASQVMAPAGFLRRHELSVWASVPSAVQVLARMKLLGPGVFPSLRATMLIGEALTMDTARAWREAAPNAVVANHYGPTEAAVACTWMVVDGDTKPTPGRDTVPIGRPYQGMTVEVLDGNGCFAADGCEGELVLHGPQLADGYLGDAARTAAAFPVLDHPRLGPRRWYRTGDLGRRDADGLLHWLGRVDHQVKVRGHRVELEDVEAHLRAASGSDAVAVVAWPSSGGTADGLVAFVGGGAPPDEVRARLREALPAYMVPRRVVSVDALPLGIHGKVDRAALVAMLDAEGRAA